MTLDNLNRVFTACMLDAQVYVRDAPGGSLFEVETLKKEKKNWLALAAGVRDIESNNIFPTNSGRAERATIPLNIVVGGRDQQFRYPRAAR